MTETFSPISWLIVALPVLSFLLIALVIVVSGKTQRFARAVSPWVLVACLAAALVISLGALRETLARDTEATHLVTATQDHGGAHHRDTEPHPLGTWYQKSIDWMVPEPATEQVETSAVLPKPPTDRTLRVGVLLDPLAAVMLVVVLVVSLLVQIYSFGYMKREEHPRFYLYMSLFTASMLGLVISSSLLQLFIFWELVGLCSYLLIGFWYHKPEAARAAIKAFVVTRFGDLGLLFAVIFLWLGYGNLSFDALSDAIRMDATLAPVSMAVIALLIFFGAMGKSAQFPLHIWLPDAMEGPTSVSALIHAATMVAAGIFLVARTFFIFEAGPSSLLVVALIGAFTALLAASIALAQTDMKKVMAYSTISQLGYMMMGLGLAVPAAAFFHLTTHAFFKALLFLTAGSVIHAVHTQNIWEMGGLWKKMKVTAITCAIGGLALAGIPLLAGFFSKDKLLEGAWEAMLGRAHGAAAASIGAGVGTLILVMALAGVVMTAFYTARMWTLVFLGKPRSHGAEHAHESPFSMTFALVVLAAITLVAGFWLVPGLTEMQWRADNGFHHLSPVGIIGFILAVGGILWGYRVYSKAPAEEPLCKLGFVYAGMVNLWWINAFFVWLAGTVVLGLGSFIRWFDKTVIDGGLVDGTAWLTGRVGHTFRRVGAGPLPGQLQYYAFVIFLIAVLVILGVSFFGSLGLTMGVAGR
ncbi:MAG: NADH-quinone oxidoreductase subunit L [Armatimonadota bacterium]